MKTCYLQVTLLRKRTGFAYTIALTGLASVFVFLATYFLKIPWGINSYFHLGDAFIFVIAILLGPWVGAVAGSVGSALADMVGGYAIWAPFTFIIKGIEGYIVGRLANPNGKQRNLIAMLAGSIWFILAYVLVAYLLFGYGYAVVELVGNIFQAIGAVILALFAYRNLHRGIPILRTVRETYTRRD